MLQMIYFQFPHITNVKCAFQTRRLDCSSNSSPDSFKNAFAMGNISLEVGDDPLHVQKNREDILNTLKVKSFTDVKQIHSTHTVFEPSASSASSFAPYEADGMASTQKNHALCIKTADCQPILIAEKEGKHILALHAGWRGNRQNYPTLAIEEFCKHYALKAENLYAVRGPSLSPALSEFVNYDEEWGSDFDLWFDKKYHTVNLWELTKIQLQSAGVPLENIYSLDLCTYSNEESFYSYRKNKVTGRQGSFIWIKE